MPLTHDFFVPNACELAVWKIEESPEVLARGLPLNLEQTHALELRKTPKTKQGFLAVRQALTSLNIPLDALHFSSHGAPQLPNQYCSLSHTQDYAAAVVSPTQIGIDIEAHRDKIKRIAPKFIHKAEKNILKTQDIIASLTRIWTAKEAVYKILEQPGLSFAEQILVHPFNLKNRHGTAQAFLSEGTIMFQLQFATFKQHELTIAQPI